MKKAFDRQFLPLVIAIVVLIPIIVISRFLFKIYTAPQAQYGALTFGVDDYSLLKVDNLSSSGLITKERPNHFRIFDIYDLNNRLTDNLWIKRQFWPRQGIVYDWNRFKYIPINSPDNGVASNKGLVIHDRFQPKMPPMSWPEFSVSASFGEEPVESTLPVRDVKIIAAYLVYFYDSSDLLYASYGADGTLTQIACRSSINSGYYHAKENPNSRHPFVDYQLPAKLMFDLKSPPINSVIQSGLDHVKSGSHKKSKLVGCFIIGRAYDLNTICVRSFDANGLPVDEKAYEYRKRPWDEEVAQSYWAKE